MSEIPFPDWIYTRTFTAQAEKFKTTPETLYLKIVDPNKPFNYKGKDELADFLCTVAWQLIETRI